MEKGFKLAQEDCLKDQQKFIVSGQELIDEKGYPLTEIDISIETNKQQYKRYFATYIATAKEDVNTESDDKEDKEKVEEVQPEAEGEAQPEAEGEAQVEEEPQEKKITEKEDSVVEPEVVEEKAEEVDDYLYYRLTDTDLEFFLNKLSTIKKFRGGLNLGGHDLSDQATQWIANLLSNNFPEITELNLKGNTRIGPKGFEILGDALSQNKTLIKQNLEGLTGGVVGGQ